MWRVVLLLVLGCGRIHFDQESNPIADATTDAISPDACTLGPCGAPRALTELNTPNDEQGPWLSEDRLEIWFTSGTSGTGYALFRARRATAGATFDPPQRIDLGLAGSQDDTFITDDGLVLY